MASAEVVAASAAVRSHLGGGRGRLGVGRVPQSACTAAVEVAPRSSAILVPPQPVPWWPHPAPWWPHPERQTCRHGQVVHFGLPALGHHLLAISGRPGALARYRDTSPRPPDASPLQRTSRAACALVLADSASRASSSAMRAASAASIAACESGFELGDPFRSRPCIGRRRPSVPRPQPSRPPTWHRPRPSPLAASASSSAVLRRLHHAGIPHGIRQRRLRLSLLRLRDVTLSLPRRPTSLHQPPHRSPPWLPS